MGIVKITLNIITYPTHQREVINVRLDDRISEDIIKIFHNSKGSIQNNIVKWTSDANEHYKAKSHSDKRFQSNSKLSSAGQSKPVLQQDKKE